MELNSDKDFVWESVEELKARIAKNHLLIIASPASITLARRCQMVPPRPGWRSSAAIFRFNLAKDTLTRIDEFAESVRPLMRKEFVGLRVGEGIELALKNSPLYLFTGGIVDPTYKNVWLRGQAFRYECTVD